MTGAGLIPVRRRIWLYAIVIATLIFLIAPIFVVVPASFSDSKYLAFPPPAYSTRWYESYFASYDWRAATYASLKAAALTALITTIVGTSAAYAIQSSGQRFSRIANIIILLPMVVPHILIAIGVFYLYVQLKLVNTMIGIVLAHSLVALPFVVVTVLAGLKSLDPRLEQVARSLGAPRFNAFLRVTLPQMRPSVVSAALFAFVVSLDEIVISLFVAGGDNTVLTRRMFVALRDAVDPTVAAISTFFIVASLGLSALATFSRRRR